MPHIAVSGHRGMPDATNRLIDTAIRAKLATRADPVTGITCLADGADQIYARAVLDHGGTIKAVIPAEKYREALPEEHHAEYDDLLAQAAEVHRLQFVESTAESHMQASAFMLEHADELWAIWDGRPARGYGGTADVVELARQKGVPVAVIWPDGATRD